jgi:hypothetical protein
VAERDWRHAYPRHWRALVRAQAARPVGVVASARAGLGAAWHELNFVRAGKPLALADAMRTPQRPLQTLQLRGQGDATPAPWSVPHQGKLLRGDTLARQIDRWEKAGVCEPAHAAALRDCQANPEWFDLSDQHLVLLGAGSEAGPLAWLAQWRANLIGVDLARAATWKRIAATVAAGNATLTAPVAPEQPLDIAHAGADLLADTPEIAAWLAALGRPLSIANLAYLDGERHLRVALAMDAISATLCAADARTQLAYMATPTDVFAVPEDLAGASRRTSRRCSMPATSAAGGWWTPSSSSKAPTTRWPSGCSSGGLSWPAPTGTASPSTWRPAPRPPRSSPTRCWPRASAAPRPLAWRSSRRPPPMR